MLLFTCSNLPATLSVIPGKVFCRFIVIWTGKLIRQKSSQWEKNVGRSGRRMTKWQDRECFPILAYIWINSELMAVLTSSLCYNTMEAYFQMIVYSDLCNLHKTQCFWKERSFLMEMYRVVCCSSILDSRES